MSIKRRRVKPKPVRRYASGGIVESILTRARSSYRAATPDFELVDCLRSLNYFEDKSEHLTVEIIDYKTAQPLRAFPHTPFSAPVHGLMGTAELLEKSYQTFWRWVSRDGIVPSPILRTVGDGKPRMVYHREEVRALITIIGEHFRQFKYYRQDHVQTRKRLFDALDLIRADLKQEQIQNGNQQARSSSVRRKGKHKKVRIRRS